MFPVPGFPKANRWHKCRMITIDGINLFRSQTTVSSQIGEVNWKTDKHLGSARNCHRNSVSLWLYTELLVVNTWYCLHANYAAGSVNSTVSVPCRLQHNNVPVFDFSFRRYYCLLVYIVCFPTYPFFFTFSSLISSLTDFFLWEYLPAPFPDQMT